MNAPPISWRVLLTTLGIVALLMFGESMIVSYMQDHLPAMISFLAHYCLLFCAVLAAAFILYRRRIYVQPLSAVAQAARRVAQGDLSVRLSPIRKDGRRDEVEALIEDFNTMVEELQSVEMLKTDFISSVSHEFKSPLAVIQSYAAALKDETLSPAERRDCADAVIDASRRLSGMVGNILRLSKMEQQQSPPPGKPYQLGEQLRRCALEQMDAWQEKGIDFAVDVADVLVCHDEGMLETVWNNLIGNAVKFSPPGGRIELTSRAEGESVLVSIRDHGCGMTPETQKRIFDKFYQGDPSHATRGNGLGLAIVKRVLELVEAALGEGHDAQTILDALVRGMQMLGDDFSAGRAFVPEMLVAARSMNAATDRLKPLLAAGGQKSAGRVCLGTVRGDMHDIGKNLVKIMMEGAGLEVIDLGVDVSAETFVDTAVSEHCDIIACSALLTTTMDEMRRVVTLAGERGIRGEVKVMIGGAPITQQYCDEIGADCYTPDAAQAARAALAMVKG